MSLVLNSLLSDPLKDCLIDKPITDPDDFSICGDEIVEGDEECDCGWHYLTCSDPCCYAAHIDPSDLSLNSSATPCRTHSSYHCKHPYSSIWQMGFVYPWIFIGIIVFFSALILVYDWKHDKRFYDHVTQPKDMIRSETEEQMVRRINRQTAVGKRNFVLQSTVINGHPLSGPPGRPAPPPPPQGPDPSGSRHWVPEQPNTGLVKQMREQLERKH